jgi:TPR repeat protein
MYQDGTGVPKNEQEAVKWFTKAAEQGDADGQVWLGAMYLGGRGVPKNEQEAVKWLTKAAEQGNADAREALQRMGK